jgi:sulfur carrier protein
MKVTINGAAQELDSGASVGTCVRVLTTATGGVAAALNGEIVRRASWEETPVAEGDVVEVITAVQGG